VHKEEHNQCGLDGGDQERDHRIEGAQINEGSFTVMAVSTSNPMPRATEKARDVACSDIISSQFSVPGSQYIRSQSIAFA